MLDERRRINLFLVFSALVLSAALFTLGRLPSGSLSDLLTGAAASVLAVGLWGVAAALDLRLIDRRKRQFFGDDLADKQVVVVCADFVAQDPASGRELVRPRAREREVLLPVGDRTRFRIAFNTYSSSDIEAALLVASGVGSTARIATAKMMSDTSLFNGRPLSTLPPASGSFFSIGLTSNNVTLAYLTAPDAKFSMTIEAGHLTLHVPGKGNFYDSDTMHYGIIVRRPLPPPAKFVWLVGGIGPAGTLAAAQYLTSSWRVLARTRHAHFLAVVSVQDGGVPTLATTLD